MRPIRKGEKRGWPIRNRGKEGRERIGEASDLLDPVSPATRLDSFHLFRRFFVYFYGEPCQTTTWETLHDLPSTYSTQKMDENWPWLCENRTVGAASSRAAIGRFWKPHRQPPPSIGSSLPQEQSPINLGGLIACLRMNQKTPFIGFPAVRGKFEVFPGQIDLSHRYESCSTHWDLHFCEVWEFLEIVDFFGESGQPTATYSGSWQRAVDDIFRLNYVPWVQFW